MLKKLFNWLFPKKEDPKMWCCLYNDGSRTWPMTWDEARAYRKDHFQSTTSIEIYD
jgi:hypothetical protein